MSGTTQTEGGFARGVADTSRQVEGVADFKGDRHADILWRQVPSAAVYIWTMTGTSH